MARGVQGGVHRRLSVDVLIATDLASEGLDLQDADAVVHYDLPWTPVRLAQRIGRTVRLGSTQRQVRVTWFAPPPTLERHLRIERRLSRKAQLQMALSTPATAVVGRSRLFNRAVSAKEWLGHDEPDGRHASSPRPAYAVVRGPAALVAAIRWDVRSAIIEDVVALEGSPPRLITNPWAAYRLLARLRGETVREVAIEPDLLRGLMRVLRSRLRLAHAGDSGKATLSHRRRVLVRGVAAAKARDAAAITLLDRVLGCLQHGTRIGAARRLGALLDSGMPHAAVADWLRDVPMSGFDQPGVEVLAVLAGDGSIRP